MKIDVASLNNDAKSKGKAEPALPLIPIDTSDQTDREMISLTLAVNPADQNSPKYKAKFLTGNILFLRTRMNPIKDSFTIRENRCSA